MIRQKAILCIVLLKMFVPLLAQEILTQSGLNYIKQIKHKENRIKTAPARPVELPFIEDFSCSGPFPNPALWADQYVFVNSTFPLFPPTVGVATFDALNDKGEIYEAALLNPSHFQADALTSQPIRLDSVLMPSPRKLSVADSIIFSFHYQPQGKGSAPRPRDSLVLEFLHTPGYYAIDPTNPENQIWINDRWSKIWSTPGSTLENFTVANDGSSFQRVVITILDSIYFRSDFRFRFRNYGSFPLTKSLPNFAGNTGIWNIDYIKLDYGRSSGDPYYYDIAFVEPAHSILRRFHSIPWNHFIQNPQAFLRSNLNLTISNLDNQTHNYSYRYIIKNEQGTIIRTYMGGTWNIAPFHIAGYQTYTPHANPLLIPNPIPVAHGEARLFSIHHIIRMGARGDNVPRNDTVTFYQIFDNFFSYDDGIAEAGYGLVGFNPQGALRYILGTSDTLTEIKFFFNTTLNQQNIHPFHLKVWKSLNPEEVIYRSDVVTPRFETGLNQFVSYKLSTPLIISDTIYIGWQQLTNEILNIGFDLNNNARENLFFNTSGQWMPSIIDGAIMIRPVFGAAVFENAPKKDVSTAPRIFPNPASGTNVTIDFGEPIEAPLTVKVLDITGRVLFTVLNQNEIDISGLTGGVYLVRITNHDNNKTSLLKLFIAR